MPKRSKSPSFRAYVFAPAQSPVASIFPTAFSRRLSDLFAKKSSQFIPPPLPRETPRSGSRSSCARWRSFCALKRSCSACWRSFCALKRSCWACMRSTSRRDQSGSIWASATAGETPQRAAAKTVDFRNLALRAVNASNSHRNARQAARRHAVFPRSSVRNGSKADTRRYNLWPLTRF